MPDARAITMRSLVGAAMTVVVGLAVRPAIAAPDEALLKQARDDVPAYLDTLKELVSIESGSRDLEGLRKLADLLLARFKDMGAQTRLIEPTDIYRMGDSPEKFGPVVEAVFKGQGTKKLMMIAHMDTVYQQGMLKDQPFRVDGDKAYGLGIADDKQGIAMILHAIRMMHAAGVKNYDTLTVLINGDEEISSPASRATISDTAADQDAIFSFEGSGANGGVRLATSGIAAAYLDVKGKAAHAGAKPEDGVNALTELSHQLLQMQDLSQPDTGLKLNWTVAKAGNTRNVIPASASAQADARALKMEDFDGLKKSLEERVKNQRLKDAKVDLKFELRRPPMVANDAGRAIAAQAQQIYKDLGISMKVADRASGGGTDAAFAGLKTKGGVLEGMGAYGHGAHSNDAEYIEIPSIAPRLYMITKLLGDFTK